MMWKMYLLGLLGNLYDLTAALAILSGCGAFGCFFVRVMGSGDLKGETLANVTKWGKRCLYSCIVLAALNTFIPSTKQLYAIVGIGGTLEYLQSNDKAKQLPDKVIDAMYKYFDDNNKEEK